MNKRLIKSLKLLLLIVITFFSFNLKTFAALKPKWIYHKCLSNISSSDYDILVYKKSESSGAWSYGYTIKMNPKFVGIYSMDGKQAYCIEPGAHLNAPTYTSSSLGGYNHKFLADSQGGATKKEMIQKILTFAAKVDKIPSESTNANKNSVDCPTDSKYVFQVYATQQLIWEVATGERTISDIKTGKVAPSNKAKSNSFYDRYISGKNNVLSQTYNAIIKKVYEAFYKNPKNFSTEAKAKTISLSWNASKGKFTTTISDSLFSYWEISEKSGLEVTKNNNSITISSSNPIDKNSAKTVKISVYNKNKGDLKAYYHSTSQDLIGVVGTTRTLAVKVYTPKYQLKIIKKSQLDNKLLKGATFNICSDSSCTKVLKTDVTNDKGEITYSNIPAPGTYYVKETNVPQGYELDSSVKKVTVTNSNTAGSSSYATITVTNKNKEFNLTKKTVDEDGNVVVLDDGCGTDTYTGPEFEILENNKNVYFKEVSPGVYDVSSSSTDGAVKSLKTCNGKFKVRTLPSCKYTINEVKPPEGLTLPSEPSKSVNVCGADSNVSFTNGFAGLEFQKKDEDGNFVNGGKFSLQRKINNVYKDILLKEQQPGMYSYDANLSTNNGTYIILTQGGIAHISKLPPGEYRVVEKEAPEGYELIEDKNSTALVTIKDSDADGYYLTEMIDQKVVKIGSRDSAELIVTITTGRKVPNYVLIILGLTAVLVGVILLRKKVKK